MVQISLVSRELNETYVTFSVQYAFCAGIMIAPVGAIQLVQPDRPAGAGRMHEAPFTDVNSHMAHAALAAEEDQIGRGQLFRSDARPLDAGKLARGARQAQIQHVAVDV